MWDKRSIYCLIAIMVYCMGFNSYLHLLTSCEDAAVPKLFYNYLTGAMVVFCFLDIKNGITTFLHEQFNYLSIACLIFNYIFIILTHHKILTNPVYIFWWFNGSVFVTSSLVFISGIRHGYFKN